jgi:hypothetical protein
VSKVVQDVLDAYGGTADLIRFGVVQGAFLTQYALGQGELGKLQLVEFD